MLCQSKVRASSDDCGLHPGCNQIVKHTTWMGNSAVHTSSSITPTARAQDCPPEGRTFRQLSKSWLSGAGTITNAAKVLKDSGAREIYVCATHAVFSPPAVERLSSGAFQEVHNLSLVMQ